MTLVALALLIALSLSITRADVASSSRRQSDSIARGLRTGVAATYQPASGWSSSALRPVLAVASSYEARVTIRDSQGEVVATNAASTPPAPALQPAASMAIVDHGSRVGSLTVQLPKNGPVTRDRLLQGSLALAISASAALALAATIAAAFLVAARVARPVRVITTAAHDLSAGMWSTRVGAHFETDELNELGQAFDSLAANLEREDAVRRTLTVEIAHELRTPLAVLQASAEGLLDGVVTPELSTFQSLHEEVLRLSKMIDDLEALAAAQAAGLHLEHTVVELDVLAEETAAGMGAMFRDAGVELTTHLEPVTVVGDPVRLRQIVTNLLSNAAKYTDRGGSVDLTTKALRDAATLIVSDTGVGIPGPEVPHLFDPFWRSPRSSEIRGTGVGLVIVRELVEAHGGSIRVDTTLGVGSQFVVVLPRQFGETNRISAV